MQERFEGRQPLAAAARRRIMQQLLRAELLELTLADKYPASKRWVSQIHFKHGEGKVLKLPCWLAHRPAPKPCMHFWSGGIAIDAARYAP